MTRILITGAAGRIGGFLARGLRSDVVDIVATDLAAPTDPIDGVTFVSADLTDPVDAERLMAGVNAVVHMAGHPNSRDWAVVNSLNVDMVRNLLEAAGKAGVDRFISASSNHVVGFNEAEVRLSDAMPFRPDSPYGVSKVFGEVLLHYYCELYAMVGFALRIGACRPDASNARELRMWLSHADMIRLVQACLTTTVSGSRPVWGMSKNTRLVGDFPSWAEIGYAPQDDAEQFVDALEAKGVDTRIFSEWPYLGGRFVPEGFPPPPRS